MTQKPKTKGQTSRIPGVKKPNSVARTNNVGRHEEKKRHKGKTPSFGNSNAPLFLNNFQINPEDINSENITPHYQEEEIKTDRRSYTKFPSSEVPDKWSAPILSHRGEKKSGSKRPTRPGQRNRPLSKKASPNGMNSSPNNTYSSKPNSHGKVVLLICRQELQHQFWYQECL